MKQKLLLTIAISILSIFMVQVNYGQIQISIPWGKKKKEETKKAETQPTPSPSPVSTGSNSSTGSQKSAPKTEENPLGTIYFSNKPFPEGGGVEGAKTSFTSNDYIYGRLVLKGGTVRQILKPALVKKGSNLSWLDVNFYEDSISSNNNLFSAFNFAVISNDVLDQSYWDFDIYPSPDAVNTLYANTFAIAEYSSQDWLHRFINNANDQSYKIFIRIRSATEDYKGNVEPEDKWLKIIGEFKYDFRRDHYKTIQANYEKINKAIETNVTPLPSEWTARSNGFAFGITEPQLRSIYMPYLAKGSKIFKLFAHPASGAAKWTIYKNEFGIPKYRYVSQLYTVFAKHGDSGKCFFERFFLKQNYSGGGTYGETVVGVDSYKETSCSKLGVK